MVDSEAGRDEHRYRVMPENKETLRKRWKMSKTHREMILKRPPLAK